MNIFYQGPINVSGELSEEELQEIAFYHKGVVTMAGPINAQHMKDLNPNLMMLRYFNLKGVHTYDSSWNQFNSLNLQRRDDRGNPLIHATYKWYLADVRKSNCADLLVQTIQNLPELSVYDGLMMDDTSLSWPYDFTAPEEDMDNYIASFDQSYSGLHYTLNQIVSSFPDKIIVFNGYNTWTSGQDLTQYDGTHFIDNADGMSFEGFSGPGNRFFSNDRIITHLKQFQHLASTYDRIYSINEIGNTLDYNHRIFSLSLFLLGFQPNISQSYYNYIGLEEGYFQPYPEYHLDLGNPLEMMQESSGIYSRRLENVTVYVNLSLGDFALNFMGKEKLILEGGGNRNNFGSVSWQAVESVILPPTSAIIVRNSVNVSILNIF